tara:strand:+ start:663 stop:1349 length:687 start_codon:yes stop_codon:yes gene_type:complete
MSLLSEIQSIPTQWKEVILTFAQDYPEEWNKLELMSTKYDGEIQIYPLRENIFRCFNYFDPEETTVVLMGQDPYHGLNQAIGLCFGVPECEKVPPSLRNIKKELKADVGKSHMSQSLEHWAKQGILMLNASLTVRQGQASSHMKLWLPFTKYIMQYLNKNHEGIVYLIWGAFAHKQVEDAIDWSKNKLVISSHPSPLSANKSYKEHPSFMGSRPFSKVNALLEKKIDW